MKPNSVDAGMLNNTFARWHEGYEPTIDNCYYVETDNLPTDQGKQAYAFTTAPANLGSLVQDYGFITAYENGILYDGIYYVASTGSISLTVEGYGESTGSDHWAFIASPVEGSIEATEVDNLVAETGTEYDLYQLNPGTVAWENWKQNEGNAAPGFNLANGQGYLYATKETKTLVFSGTFNMDNEKTIGNLPAGFNLVGNPFVVEAYADRSYYRMNDAGDDIEAVENYAGNAIPVCTGVVVKAETSDESVTFSTTAPAQQSSGDAVSLQMTLVKGDPNSRDAKVHDKAIVSFSRDGRLEKFVFNERHAKLYIPQDGNDYAIAFSEMTGEVALNFKASETGRYTIGFNFENVKGVRIQLTDKLEDKIIDLKAIDSYTFMGSTADRSDRFSLVFTWVEAGSIFAYQSGDDIVVSGEGELQVFDVTGRMVMTLRINGVQTVAKPDQTGVYILKLNGMAQKIVIR